MKFIEKSFDINISPLPKFIGAGECLVKQGWIHPKEKYDNYKLIVSETGTFHISVEEKETVIITPGEYVLIPPNTSWETTKKSNENDKFWWIMFSCSNSSICESIALNSYGAIPQPESLRQVFTRLLDCLYKTPEPVIGLQLGISQVLVELYRQIWSINKKEIADTKGKTHDISNQVIIYMNEYIKRNLNIKDLSNHLNLNSDYLRRVFKKATGKTPLQYHRRLRIKEAKKLIENGELTISQIAYEIGYDNVGYFSRVFKRETGYWPTEFLRRNTVVQNVDGEFYPFVKRL